MNLDKYNFVFGLGFLKEINKRYVIKHDGVEVKAGLETILPNLANSDVETLLEVLKIANQTEKEKASYAELERIITEAEDIEGLFEEVLGALEESNFTAIKAKRFMKVVRNQKG